MYWTTKLETFDPLMEAHGRHEQSLVESVAVWTERVTQFESIRDAGGGRVGEFAEARGTLTSARAELADVQEKKAELIASQAETVAGLDAARSRLHYLLDAAASVVGVDRTALTSNAQSESDPHPAWAVIDTIEVRATESGIVESLGLTNGSWADEKSPVMTIVRPDQLRFHASGLQSDLGVLRNGLEARIVPPTPTTSGRAVPLQDTMTGTLALGLQGDASDRTVDLYVVPEALSTWARPGVAAQLEIVTDSTAAAELAIPLAAVQKDGLTPDHLPASTGQPERGCAPRSRPRDERWALGGGAERLAERRRSRPRRCIPTHARYERDDPEGWALPLRRHIPRRGALRC